MPKRHRTKPPRYRRGDAQGGTAIPGGGGMIKFDSSTNTVTFGFSGAACKGIINAQRMFFGCSRLNQDIYIYSQVLNDMNGMFTGTKVNQHNVHIPSSVPKDTSNYIYNSLVNGEAGLVFAAENIINDLPVNPVV